MRQGAEAVIEKGYKDVEAMRRRVAEVIQPAAPTDGEQR
jgi:hypothetical protein